MERNFLDEIHVFMVYTVTQYLVIIVGKCIICTILGNFC